MQLGLFNLMTLRDRTVTPTRILEDTRLMVEGAEELGFDTAWFAEHHFSNYSICPSPLMMASYAAGFTKRIKLGTAVLVLPFYNPMRMIEEIGLLDVQSGGRARIGIGYGYQMHEFKRFNRIPAEKVEVALEAWDIIDMAFREHHVDFHGKHFDITDCPLAITPVHKPEIFVAGLEPVILQRVAKGGHTPYINGSWRNPQLVRDNRRHIDNMYRAAGADPEQAPIAVHQFVFVTDDKQEALDMAERTRYISRIITAMRTENVDLDGPYIRERPAPDELPLETIRDGLLAGDPHSIAERLVVEIKDLRTTHLCISTHVASNEGKRARRMLERFVKEVVPLVEKAFGMPLDQVHKDREIGRVYA